MTHTIALVPNKLILSRFSNKDIKLTKADIDFLLILFSYISPDDQADTIYEIQKIDLVKKFGLSQHSLYRDLRESLIRLQSFVFDVATVGRGKYVNTFKHENKENSSSITLKFAKELHNMVTDIKPGCEGFTRIQVSRVLALKSEYSKKMYLHLSSYQEADELELDETQLRSILDVQDNYKMFSDVINYGLRIAINELAFSDKPFKFAPVKTGKKITGVKITMLKGSSLQVVTDNGATYNKQTVNTDLLPAERNKILGYLQAKIYLSKENAEKLLNRVEIPKLQPVVKDLEQRYKIDENKPFPQWKYKGKAGYTMRTLTGVFSPMIFKSDSEYSEFISMQPKTVAA